MKKGNKKGKELSREDLFEFFIGDSRYPGTDKEYIDASKIHNCCVIKKGHLHCYECSKFPCGKYSDIKESMKDNGYKLIKYQKSLKKTKKDKKKK